MALPSSIADIVAQTEFDITNGKLIHKGRNNRGTLDGKEVSGIKGVPAGILSATQKIAVGVSGTTYFGYLIDAGHSDYLLHFYVHDNQALASLLKVAEQMKEPVTVSGMLHSTLHQMYELEVTNCAPFHNIKLQ